MTGKFKDVIPILDVRDVQMTNIRGILARDFKFQLQRGIENPGYE